MAELIRKFAQPQSLLADSQAIELHELGLVEFDRDPRPEGIEVVKLPAGRRSDRHDCVRRQVENTRDGIHGGTDGTSLRPRRRGDVIGGPLFRGAQFIDIGSVPEPRPGAEDKLRFGCPGTKILKALAIKPARRLRRGGDPTR